MTNQEAILQALNLARNMSYNDDAQAPAKHVLQELAHRLDRARTINCDQVAWMLSAIDLYLSSSVNLTVAPRVSRAREMQKYGLLYELMEVAGLTFADEIAAGNGTPRDVRALQRRNQPYAGDVLPDRSNKVGSGTNMAAMSQANGVVGAQA